ncbi:MAG: bifunctional glutamate N-acetyltransferase/amino-acid acetyltransferase ArgJ [Alphaproteobacteria bacterium]|nr:bifunctional glutamate N-acetyltransferase/amino-acid acetyltransferase ArgJ [Alphaproteobacteria bacterium]
MSGISPLAPKKFPAMPALAGLRLAAIAAAERYRGRDDLLLAEFSPGTRVAGVLTRSKAPGAPVKWCRQLLPKGRARGLVVNAGNANVFTGKAGEAAVGRTAKAAAKLLGASADEIYIASTGVIGEALKVERIIGALAPLHDKLSPTSWRAGAGAIMTTDTFAKGAWRRAEIDGASVNIAGIAKGSGMIAPNMATMLAFLFTDARLPVRVLNSVLRPANQRSFNSLTVDGDTSTSDTCLLFATGAGARHGAVARAMDKRLDGFRAALEAVMTDLAQQVARDGEGAQKFLTVRVCGAASKAAARRAALVVANSPLVKTAVAGADPNWGRLVMAIGRSGEKIKAEKMVISIGAQTVARGGRQAPGYSEEKAARHMRGPEIDIAIDLAVGGGAATVWSCDLTHRYIDINGDYRS